MNPADRFNAAVKLRQKNQLDECQEECDCLAHCPVHSPAPFVFAGEMQSGIVSGEQENLF